MTFEERKAQVKFYLGKMGVIGIDRTIGYIRKKGNYSLTYPINYDRYYDTEVEVL